MVRWVLAASTCVAVTGVVCVALADTPAPLSAQARQAAVKLDKQPPVAVPRSSRPLIDRSGRTEAGKASFYANSFSGRKMADGNRLRPTGNSAASKTLPIGTTAKVINLQTGQSATVKIEDRGPHVAGRVIDLSRSVASRLDIRKDGVAPVQVKPITVPQPDGSVKLGTGAAAMPEDQLQQAVRTTMQLAQ